MRRLFGWAAPMVLLCGLASAAEAAGSQPFLFDVLRRPVYRAAWQAMLGHEGGLPRWLVQYARTLDGPATPGATAVVDGTRREFYHVCEAHNCADSQFEVMFPAGGGGARGLLTVAGQPPRFLGSPDAAERQALATANSR